MSRRLVVIDRIAGLLLGLLLIAGGLLAIDWRTGTVLDLPASIDAGVVDDVVSSAWWPWVFAGVGVLLGLLAVAWLLAHAGRGRTSKAELPGGNETGDLVIDLSSVASAAATRLESIAPVTEARGTARRRRKHTYVELHARVGMHADPDAVLDGAARCIQEVTAGFADGTVSCRVLLKAPKARRSDRTDRVLLDA